MYQFLSQSILKWSEKCPPKPQTTTKRWPQIASVLLLDICRRVERSRRCKAEMFLVPKSNQTSTYEKLRLRRQGSERPFDELGSVLIRHGGMRTCSFPLQHPSLCPSSAPSSMTAQMHRCLCVGWNQRSARVMGPVRWPHYRKRRFCTVSTARLLVSSLFGFLTDSTNQAPMKSVSGCLLVYHFLGEM